jgi:hypothetical protein
MEPRTLKFAISVAISGPPPELPLGLRRPLHLLVLLLTAALVSVVLIAMVCGFLELKYLLRISLLITAVWSFIRIKEAAINWIVRSIEAAPLMPPWLMLVLAVYLLAKLLNVLPAIEGH